MELWKQLADAMSQISVGGRPIWIARSYVVVYGEMVESRKKVT